MTEKNCLICGTPIIDNSRNQVKNTCSKKCLRILYNQSDPDKRIYNLVRMRVNVLRLKGVAVDESEVIRIREKLEKGICEICGKFYGFGGLCIDHCHSENKIRGIICYKCNQVLGHSKDNPEILNACIEYLLK